MSEHSDEVYLRHMLEEIQFIQRRCSGLTFEAFRDDEVPRRATVRSLEVIGEASKNLSPGVRAAYGEIDWKRIAGLRDVLIHQYFGIDWHTVWDVAEHKVPPLERQIGALINDE